MARRLDLDDEELGELFGVEIDPRKTSKGVPEDPRIKVKVKDDRANRRGRDVGEHRQVAPRGAAARVRHAWASTPPATRKALAWGTGGILLGGFAAVLGGRVARALSGAPNPGGTSPTEPPAAPPPPRPAEKTAHRGAALSVVGKLAARLRAAPSETAAILGLLKPGAGVIVDDSAVGPDGARWYKVTTHDGRSGWVHGSLLG